MLFRRRRHRRWIAFIALFGLLFQQLAMGVYVCPLESGDPSAVAAMTQPCGSPDTPDKSRCDQHCHPLAQTSDHATPPTVPAALLPPTTWLRTPLAIRVHLPESPACEVAAHAAAPPLTIQHCTFQI
jgi:hypothetical protein